MPAGGPPAQAPAGGKKGGRSIDALLTIYLEKCYNNVEALRQATQEVKNEHLTEGVEIYIKLLDNQEAVLRTMEACAKPADMSFMV